MGNDKAPTIGARRDKNVTSVKKKKFLRLRGDRGPDYLLFTVSVLQFPYCNTESVIQFP